MLEKLARPEQHGHANGCSDHESARSKTPDPLGVPVVRVIPTDEEQIIAQVTRHTAGIWTYSAGSVRKKSKGGA